MNIREEQAIRAKASDLMLDWSASKDPPFSGESPEGYGEALQVAHIIADESKLSLHRWIDSARRVGLSWADIGDALGISKQAAQQRFGAGQIDVDEEGTNTQTVRLGATAFNEMKIMREEGERGNELVGVGFLLLIFRKTSQTWEYDRVSALGPTYPNRLKEGWQRVDAWGPFVYLKRPLQ